MKRIMIFCLLWIFLTSPAMAATVNRVAAIVNDEVITTYQLEQAVAAERRKNSLGELSNKALSRLQDQILQGMIDEKLFLQRVRDSTLIGGIVRDPGSELQFGTIFSTL